MTDIYHVETIGGMSSSTFDRLLNSAIARWQGQGLEVEIKPFTAGGAAVGTPRYQALVIARRRGVD